MTPVGIQERLTSLEARMTALEQLPGRMDHLDGRMARLDGRMDRLERRIDQLASELRGEIRAVDQTLREEMRTGHVMIVTELTEQIQESRRDTRVLFEEMVSRIARIQHLGGSDRRKKR